MPKIRGNGLKILKALHLATACCWFGGALALCALSFLKFQLQGTPTGDAALYGINYGIHMVDTYVVVIAGALGCLATGLIYSLFTNWGFFKHNWITYKWVITIAIILIGTFLLGPWEETMLAMSAANSPAELAANPGYNRVQNMFVNGGLVSASLLFSVLVVSAWKPWKKRKVV